MFYLETVPLGFVGIDGRGAQFIQESVPNIGQVRLLTQAEVRNALEPWYYIAPTAFLWWIEAWHYARRRFYYKKKKVADRKLVTELKPADAGDMAMYVLRYLGKRATEHERKKKKSTLTLKRFREVLEAGRAYAIANNDDSLTPHFKQNPAGNTKILSQEDWSEFFASVPGIVAYIADKRMLNHGEADTPFQELYDRFFSSLWAGVPISGEAVPPPPPGPPPSRPSSSAATAATAEPDAMTFEETRAKLSVNLLLLEEIRSPVDSLNKGVANWEELKELVDWVLNAQIRYNRRTPATRELEQFNENDKRRNDSMISLQTYLRAVWPCFGSVWNALSSSLEMIAYDYQEVLSDGRVEDRFFNLSESIRDVFTGVKQLAALAPDALKDYDP